MNVRHIYLGYITFCLTILLIIYFFTLSINQSNLSDQSDQSNQSNQSNQSDRIDKINKIDEFSHSDEFDLQFKLSNHEYKHEHKYKHLRTK